MMWGDYGMSGWSWAFGVLVVVGAVILIVVLVRVLSTPRTTHQESQPTPAAAPSPRQILDERYAKGELTTEEYRERLSALGLDS